MGNSADHHKKIVEEQGAHHSKPTSYVRAPLWHTVRLTLNTAWRTRFDKHAHESPMHCLAAAVAKMDAVHGRVSEEHVAREVVSTSSSTCASNPSSPEENLTQDLINLKNEITYLFFLRLIKSGDQVGCRGGRASEC